MQRYRGDACVRVKLPPNCWAENAASSFHELVVDKLVRIRGYGHYAAKRTVEADDHEKHHGDEARQTCHEHCLEVRLLNGEEERQKQATHRSGQEDQPHHARESAVHRIQPLAPHFDMRL